MKGREFIVWVKISLTPEIFVNIDISNFQHLANIFKHLKQILSTEKVNEKKWKKSI